MSTDGPASQAPTRRDELLELAATMFAERGLRATTVRDIADSAGILSGSLYHHFSSKEEMVDEVLRGFLDWLFEPLPGDRRDRTESAGAAQGSVHGVVRGDRGPARAGRHLPGRGQAAVGAAAVLLRGGAQQRATQDVGGRAQPGHRGGLLPARHRRRSGVPVHPRHHMGFGPLVSAGRTADGRTGRPAVPLHRSWRHHRKKESDMAVSSQAYVIEAVRTAVGKRNGSLAGVHPVDLGAAAGAGCSTASTSIPARSTT